MVVHPGSTGVTAKDIRLEPIDAATATAAVKRLHYSGTTVRNSTLHVGVFLHDRLEGVMQLGPPLDKRRMLPLVTGTEWPNMIELNRMAFSERIPRNGESRALGVLVRVLRAHAPQVKWVLSFADATQCGDGTIYRAAGFDLTAIKPSDNLARFPSGEVVHKMSFESSPAMKRACLGGRSYYDVTGGRYAWREFVRAVGGVILPGFQLRYVKFVDPTWRDRLAVPVLPYSAIADAGATMYRGARSV